MRAGSRSIVGKMAWTLACMAAPSLPVMAGAGAPLAQLTEPRPAVKLTLDDEHVLREFLREAPEVPKMPQEIDLTIGAEVPAEIPLQPFPAEVHNKLAQLKGHQFFVHGDRIFLVDPTRTIAEIIPRSER